MNAKLSLGKWLSCLYRTGRIYFAQHFADHGLGNGHLAYIMFLCRQDGVTQDTMRKYLYIDKATTTRSITKLEEMGYVTRSIDPLDRRAYKVFITAKGRSVAPEVRQVLDSWIDAITKGFSEEERKAAYNLLERMAENAVAVRQQHLSQRSE